MSQYQLKSKLVSVPQSQNKSKRQDVKPSDFMSYDWKINPLDSLTTTGSSFLLRSPKFTTGGLVGKSSDWYLSIKYSPESHHLHADITLVKIHDPNQKDVFGIVTLYIMRSSKLVSYKLGTLKRAFTTDQSEIFRRDTYSTNGGCDSCGLPTLQFKPIDLKMLQTLMVENKLIVRVELEILRESPSLSGSSSILESQNLSPASSVASNLEALKATRPAWETHKQTANCILKCGESHFPIHTTKLAAHSPIFATIFQSFKHLTDDFHESKCAMLTVKNVEATTMEIVLKYIYEGKLELDIWNQENPMEIFKKLLIAAEAYQLFPLRDMCLMEMCNNLTLKNCGEIAVFARTLELKPIFKKRINAFLRKNWSLVQKEKKFLALFNKHPQAFEFIFASRLR